MKRLLLIPLVLFVLSCEKKIPQKEVIINRHQNGEKQTVGIYQGEGLNEKLVLQYRYNKNGKLEYIKNSKERIEEYYINGQLVKKVINRNHFFPTNLFELLNDENIRDRVYLKGFYNMWADSDNNPDSIVALNQILNSDDAFSIVISKDATNIWYSDTGIPLSETDFLSNYFLGFNPYLYDKPIITEFGYNPMDRKNHVKAYKIIRFYMNKNKSKKSFIIEFIEIRNLDINQTVGSTKREFLTIIDPFSIEIMGKTMNRKKSYGNIFRKDLLWD